MSSHNEIDPKDFDRFVAAGQKKFDDFNRSHSNVRHGLNKQFRKHPPVLYRSLLATAAAVSLLIICLFLLKPGEEESYLAMATALRQPFSTETLSVKRGSSEETPSNTDRVSAIAEAVRVYHSDTPERAAELWRELAQQAKPDERNLFTFYQATSHWLANSPGEAIQLLVPLLSKIPESDLLYRRINYALGLAYLDLEQPGKAIPHLEYVSEIKDKMGKASLSLLGELTEE
jgi:hypothetical protein